MSPMTPEAEAALAEGERLLAAGQVDPALHAFQRVLRDAPDSWRAHFGAARAYERKGGTGPAATFWRMADREFEAAIGLAPGERELHLARLAVAGKCGRLDSLRVEYRTGPHKDLPFAGECVRMITALLVIGDRESAPPPGMGLGARVVMWTVVLAVLGGAFYLVFGWFRDSGGGAGGSTGAAFEQSAALPEAVFEPAPARPEPAAFPKDGPAPAAVATLTGHKGAVHDLAFSPGGDRLLSGSYGGTARLWSVPDGAALWNSTEDLRMITAVGWDNRLLKIMALDSGGAVATWWMRGMPPEPDAVDPAGAGPMPRIAFSPNGRLAVIVDIEGGARLRDVVASAPAGRLKAADGLHSVAFAPGGTSVVLGSVRNYLLVWDLVNRDISRVAVPRAAETADIVGLAFTPDGASLVVACMDSLVVVMNASSWRSRRRISVPGGGVAGLAVSPGGKTFATGGADGTMTLWDMASGEKLAAVEAHKGPVWALAFNPDGSLLASGGEDGAIRLWR